MDPLNEGALTIECPICGQPPGSRCYLVNALRVKRTQHHVRIERYKATLTNDELHQRHGKQFSEVKQTIPGLK